MELGEAAQPADQPLCREGGRSRHPQRLLALAAAHLLHRAKMEGIVCGPGGRYNTMPDERVDIPDYLDMIRVYMLAMLDICEPA